MAARGVEPLEPDGPRPRILMVCARYPPYIGGTETHAASVARRLVERGYAVKVVTTSLSRARVGHRVERGVEVVRLRAWPKNWDSYLAPSLFNEVRRSRADVVHLQGYHTLVAPMTLLAARGRPLVVTLHSGGHSSAIRRRLRPLQHRLLRRALLRADRLVCVSEFERRMLEGELSLRPGHTVTIPNGVSDEFLASDRLPADRATIVSVGRLEEYKGHQFVIEAMPAVLLEFPDATLEIVGTGGFRQALVERARTLGVADRVTFSSYGFADRAGLAATYSRAGVVTVMSSFESQGVAGYEAIASGAPLAVLGGSALGELSDHRGVAVVQPGDMAQLAAVIIDQLTSQPEVDRGAAMSWEVVTTTIEDLYHQVLAERRQDVGSRARPDGD